MSPPPARLLGRRTPVRVPASRPAGTALIEIDQLRVELGGRAVLDQVDLVVHTGEVIALVGPNGAGKSTLLAAIGGDVAAAAGGIRIDGRPQSAWSSTELALRRAVLTQRSVLSFPFTVAEVVRMGRAPWAGLSAEESDDPIVDQCLAATDVAQFAGRTFTSLSGGEQARAALARVLAQRAAALLLDEPTAALDLHHQELVLRLARQRAAAGDAVVVVLHDLGLAGAYADRIALLSAGRLRTVGPPEQVLTGALLSEVYRHDIEVLPHPETRLPLVVPRRQHPTRQGKEPRVE
ncbi:heme ABC transporter ATP-binding protein [Solwaraspora sp. WMMA2080]|uniref:heme ABC transporter ATP-binding protein n=1 Tax=unclassified Solwaraspora TaxID=2627926 RepID=UPI00248B686D|nr:MULTISPECIES: heme ABC transporter ATP-binding protein [unclassified Solwaraspora]WBB95971.1 heme ABC transporter ATP-binding protein [Solwaraspora sp. WMMA2059]WBC20125.1 heme ABC transporter ATP-binding protein [Solwaraspora sp. WMMA2080]